MSLAYFNAAGDLSKGVTVLSSFGDGREANDTYEAALGYQILPNGTLAVIGAGGAAIALYPPGVWVHACTTTLAEPPAPPAGAVPVVVQVVGPHLDGEPE